MGDKQKGDQPTKEAEDPNPMKNPWPEKKPLPPEHGGPNPKDFPKGHPAREDEKE
jgi:hypothetical protein